MSGLPALLEVAISLFAVFNVLAWTRLYLT